MNRIEEMILKAEEELKESFARIDENEMKRTKQVLDLFRQEGVSYRHFAPSTGYGYDDFGRDRLEKVYASIFGTEDALVRSQIVCGTHALTVALFGNTRPGDEILSPVGMPYDTLQTVIGLNGARGSLKEYGVGFRKEDEDLRDAVDAILIEMEADGTIEAISTKWFGKNISIIGAAE